MNRREFIRFLSAGVFAAAVFPSKAMGESFIDFHETAVKSLDDVIKDYLHRMKNFDQHHDSDIYVREDRLSVLSSCVNRLRRVERTVGHGNFNIIGFDETLLYARSYSQIGAFTDQELDFLEEIFCTDASLYGFYGEKPIKKITDQINRSRIHRFPRIGHYLYKGVPYQTYQRAKKEIGNDVILTSGIRSVVKQFMLFLNKADENSGNLSLASRQLAPPGYSYHGIGDFDVGKRGYGAANFTERFVSTDVYKKLVDRGFLELRYPVDNLLGVRFEPWHIKVMERFAG